MRWKPIQVDSVIGGPNDPVRYRVLQNLGAGSYGEVFKVADAKLNTICALKTVHERHQNLPQFELAALLEHFEREAQLWISLPAHENLVRASAFYEFRDQGDRPFLQMEFVGGNSLGHVLERQGGHLIPAEALHYAIGICRGMKNACDIERPDRVIIHRDISPDNILVSGFHDTPKVCDFGLARWEEEKTVGSIAGKWLYMAPEVLIRGGWLGPTGATRVDRRADIYSFAVTFYQMLTGCVPIDIRRAGRNAILGEPPQDIHAVLPEGFPPVPDELLDIVMGCLEKDPNARIAQTWDALSEQLNKLREDVEAATECRVCCNCGFRSRLTAPVSKCPVCGDTRPTTVVGRRPGESMFTSASRAKQRVVLEPVFLRVTAGQSVVGANITFLMAMREKASVDGVDLSVLSDPKAHPVDLAAFEITQTPVTQEQFARFERETGYRTGQSASSGANGNLPVTGITFREAEAFCDWLGGRLPLADEWEKAARGLDGRAYPWGNEFNRDKCACEESGAARPVPVDAHLDARGPFGLLACVGNVAELVDGGEHGSKYALGGSFSDPCRYHGLLWARVRMVKPDRRDPRIGFRVARDVDPPGTFEPRFVGVEGEAVVGCDPSLVTELECRMWLGGRVVEDLRKDPQRIVTLAPYEIGVFTVTNEEYWQFVSQTGHARPSHWRSESWSWTGRPFLNKYRYHPIVHVTQGDALEYCRWLTDNDRLYTYRLPTRDEWQAAARGREPRVYPWGNEFDVRLCNGGEASRQTTVDVREYSAGRSPSGCQQMTGNVFEWLSHQNGNTRYMRGGGFDSACELYGMTFFEVETTPGGEFESTGFRVVRQRRVSSGMRNSTRL